MKTAVHTKNTAKQITHLPGQFFFQPKLTISQPDDKYEREADIVAEQVMQSSAKDNTIPFFNSGPVAASGLQRKCAHCEAEEKIQKKEGAGLWGNTTAPSTVDNAIHSAGQPLDSNTRNFMESRFGYDFANVQIHNNAHAHQSARDINALAYTHGRDIVFGAGQYKPESDSGKQLLAHELTHVVQQNSAIHTKIAGNAIMRKPAPKPMPKVKIGKINAPDTPPKISRIIPRVEIDATVDVKNVEPGDPAVELSVKNASSDNGTARINGSFKESITNSQTIKIKGVTQTEPGNSNKLSIIASQGGKLLNESNTFSVAAYPSAIGFKFNRFLHGVKVEDFPGLFWGAVYELSTESDSGKAADCNKTSITENVTIAKHKGFFKGLDSVNSGFHNSTQRQVDYHATNGDSEESMKKSIDASDVENSILVADQFYRFACERSGIKEDRDKGPKVPVSGFRITKTLGKYFFKTKKEGFANHGVTEGTVDDTSEKKSDVS